MRSANKGVSIAVLTAAVLAMAACGSSGSIAPSAAGTSAASSAASTSVAATTTSPAVTTSSSPSVTQTASSLPGGDGGGAGTSLTTEKIKALLLTDKDDPGYTYDASKDDTSTEDTPDVVTSGGSICQTLADAMGALSTKYGTTVEVDRKLTDQAKGYMIITSVSVLPSVDKASAVISDLTAGLKGCKALTMTPQDGDGQSVSIAFDGTILMGKDQAGSVAYISNGDKTLLMAVVEVRVGTAVSVVALYEPETQDTAVLHQMGATLTTLSDIQFQRLKGAEAVI